MMGRIALLVCAAVLACGCADRRAEPLRRAGHVPVGHASKPYTKPSDAGTTASGGHDAGAVMQSSGGHGGKTAPSVMDAGRPQAKPPVVKDGATADAAVTDAQVSTPACDPAQCPNPDIEGAVWAPDPFIACCTGDGACGYVPGKVSDYVELCEKIVPGVVDPTCLDTVVDGTTIEGCCRDDGQCGHVDPILGCHQLFNHFWGWEVKQCGMAPMLVPTPSNPYECTSVDEPCTNTWECCTHYTYATQCSDPHHRGHAYCNNCPDC